MPLRPKRLEAGARVGVVSPSYWIDPARLERAVSVFEEQGYELVLGRSTGLRQDKFAGSPEERAADIMAMFTDDSIDAIVCARGGYGANRVLPLLDYELIHENPKIFVGFSDVTGLLASMAQRSGLVTFHGPMMTTYGRETEPYNLDTFHRVLSGEADVRIGAPPGCPVRVLRAGEAGGVLLGGNLSLVEERLGTACQVDTRGAILFLEEIDERLHSLDRMLLHLREAGALDHIRGLVLGEMLEIRDTAEPFGKNTDEIVLDVCSGLDFPIISNFPCGHGRFQATLPVFHEVSIRADGDDPHILIPEPPVV